jgi:hypothetical protein
MALPSSFFQARESRAITTLFAATETEFWLQRLTA